MQGPNVTASPDFQKLHWELCTKAFNIAFKMKQFEILFMGDTTHIARMNKYAPSFFGLTERVFYDDLVMSVCRVLDKAETMSKPNLTIAQMVAQLDPAADATLIQSIEARLQGSKSELLDLMKHRNQRLAHLDLTKSLSSNPAWPDIYWAMLQKCFDAIAESLNDACRHFNAFVMVFEIVGGDDARSMLHVLERLDKQDNSPQ